MIQLLELYNDLNKHLIEGNDDDDDDDDNDDCDDDDDVDDLSTVRLFLTIIKLTSSYEHV